MTWGFRATGVWEDTRGVNMLDTGAHFYDSYETGDGKYISIGSIEPQFYALLREKAGLSEAEWDAQQDRGQWPALKDRITTVFKTKTRDEWCAIMEGTDICFAPILSMAEALKHPHNVERGTFITLDGVDQPAPAPRFSGTPAPMPVGRK
jgi:alpha-methylacyl-CoA racemase